MFTEQWSDLNFAIILILDLILISILAWCAADLVGESRVTQGPSQAPKPRCGLDVKSNSIFPHTFLPKYLHLYISTLPSYLTTYYHPALTYMLNYLISVPK